VNGKYNEMKSVLKNLLSDERREKESEKKIFRTVLSTHREKIRDNADLSFLELHFSLFLFFSRETIINKNVLVYHVSS